MGTPRYLLNMGMVIVPYTLAYIPAIGVDLMLDTFVPEKSKEW